MTISFETLTELYRRMEFREEFRVGSLLLSDQSDCDLINTLLDDPREYGVSVDTGTVELGSTITLRVTPPRNGLGLVFATHSILLNAPKHQCQEPANYFILETKFRNDDVDVPVFISNYRAILKFVDLLKEAAAYFDNTTCQLVFLKKEVIKLSPRFTAETVQNLKREHLDNLMAGFNDDTHKNQKQDILIESIQAVSEGVDSQEVFEFLLVNIQRLHEQFLKGYRIYSSGFSYDKVMDQLRAAKVEEMGKIHKTFSDIQNHILGIPVASVIVATQFKEATSWSGQGVTNTIILLGCIFAATLIWLALSNQTQSIKALSEEIEYKKKQINKEFSFIKDDVDGVFRSITERLKTQKRTFRVIRGVLVIGIITAITVYCWYTKPVLDYMQSFFNRM
ncbi:MULTISPECIES: hypothetical protein [unclassified Brenneria]|uniref:hypothetical protein n=1 Tax=unclassified Brenneria TaxID=2634434 RepID=UPI0029C209FC|nr:MULTISPECIES: hypothetical protein [unclassified Brenneria]MDX5630356.1 hypothetical protein [Brenneria sp. L3-3Z]MDX5697501.1 hypothetical protein [Brenneria sp. L4-2C]